MKKVIKKNVYSQAELNNYSKQLNPNNDEYYRCRGEKKKSKRE